MQIYRLQVMMIIYKEHATVLVEIFIAGKGVYKGQSRFGRILFLFNFSEYFKRKKKL